MNGVSCTVFVVQSFALSLSKGERLPIARKNLHRRTAETPQCRAVPVLLLTILLEFVPLSLVVPDHCSEVSPDIAISRSKCGSVRSPRCQANAWGTRSRAPGVSCGSASSE